MPHLLFWILIAFFLQFNQQRMLCAMHFFCACATLDKRNFNDFRETTTEEVQAVETTETKTKEVKEVEKTEEKEEEVTFL